MIAPRSETEWRAYADELGDDPRGRWIRAALAAPGDERIATTPPIDDELLLSPRLAEHWHRWTFYWWRGFIRGASLIGAMDDPPTSETIDALFADPHAAIERLSIMHPIAETLPLWQAVLAEARPSVTHFAANHLGVGGSQLDALPDLRLLDLVGATERTFGAMMPGRRPSKLDELASRSLRTLVATCSGCAAMISGRFELPQLDELRLCPELFAGRDLSIVPLFESATSIFHRPPPALRTLFCFGVEISFAAMARCRALAQLRSASFVAIPDFTTAHIAELIEHASAFRQLDHLSSQRHGVEACAGRHRAPASRSRARVSGHEDRCRLGPLRRSAEHHGASGVGQCRLARRARPRQRVPAIHAKRLKSAAVIDV